MNLESELAELRAAWERRPLLRRLYAQWFALVEEALSAGEGPTVELGSGIGMLKEALPQVLTTDVEPTPWAERRVDAEQLPFADASLANLVLIDVFHHLPDPARFLDEAVRTLAPGGRVVILDPYISPASRLGYAFHPERVDFAAPPFASDSRIAEAPMESNQARATLVFFRHDNELARRWPELRLVERRRLALLVYPLSGGFRRRRLIPLWLVRPLEALERLLTPAARFLAFRCFIVLERNELGADRLPAQPERLERVGGDGHGVRSN